MNDGAKQTTRLYAWIAEDLDGVEGIITIPSKSGGLLPLVCTDERLARSMADGAYAAAHVRSTIPKLIAFDRAEMLWPK